MKIETKAIHVGQQPDRATGAVIIPVYQTSTYEQDGINISRGYNYSRVGNPTREALEAVLVSKTTWSVFPWRLSTVKICKRTWKKP